MTDYTSFAFLWPWMAMLLVTALAGASLITIIVMSASYLGERLAEGQKDPKRKKWSLYIP